MAIATRLRTPGWYRAALFDVLGLGFAVGLTVLVRWLMHQHPVVDGHAITIVALIAVPLFFLVGLGTADYWFYWAAGKATRAEDHSAHGAHSWRDYFRVNTDHKVIGIQYVVTSFFFLMVGGLLAMLMRAELAQPGMQFVTPEQFNGLFSMHATLLIFLFVIPVFAGLANYVLPLMIGAPDMAFPRLNALSYWMLPLAGLMMLFSLLAPGRLVRGRLDGLCTAVDDDAAGSAVLHRGGAVRGGLLDRHRAELPGHDHHHARTRDELLPDAAAGMGELLDLAAGRDRHAVHRRLAVLRAARPRARLPLLRRVRRRREERQRDHVPARLLVLLTPGRLHHDVARVRDHLGGPRRQGPKTDLRLPDDGLLAVGHRGAGLHRLGAPHVRFRMQPWIRIPMMITTAIIAIPTGIKIFSWLATLWRGVLHLDTPMLFALGFLTMFTLGGISGVMLAMIPFDIHVSQTYFIVAHIHYVLFGGSLFTIFAGVYYWFPKMTGRMFDDRLGKWHFWTTFIFFNLTFGPMHLIGIQGMPRRVADYSQQFAAWNLIISFASFGLGLSTLIFIYNIAASWRGGPRAAANPWRGAHAGVAGLLAPSDLQLRRGSDGGRRPLRVRRPRRGSRDLQVPYRDGANRRRGERIHPA